MKTCRVCWCEFSGKPLLSYKNMPKAAQILPDAATLQQESGVNMAIWQCKGCGLIQLDSEPVPYYREVIRAVAFSEEMKAFRHKQFSQFVQEHSLGRKKVLEVGCGEGEFVKLMQDAGADAFGLEFSRESVARCTQKGLRVVQGFLGHADYQIPNGPFDGFIFLNFLEHLPDPNSALRGICNNLTEGATGLVDVPNFDMMVRTSMFSEFTCDHLFYFTKRTLCAVLNLNGFDVIDCKEVWYDYIISAVVRKRKQLDIAQFNEYQAKLNTEIHQFIGRFPVQSVAIWGAGHQAFAIMALMDLGARIRYVVDSALFKQGKFTPATHIPIVAPERLNVDPVHAIIVMAGSYSDEVIRRIRENFDSKMTVAVLRNFGLEEVSYS